MEAKKDQIPQTAVPKSLERTYDKIAALYEGNNDLIPKEVDL
jgi:hypothetical protein